MATTEKYDRQLRLWGANGQRALSETHVILVHPTAVGTETLKNLVLPGVGSFHIIDETSEESTCDSSTINATATCNVDCSNFFSVPANVKNDEKKEVDDVESTTTKSQSRARLVCEHLGELNEDVQGSWEEVPSLTAMDYRALLQAQKQSQNQNNRQLVVVGADLPLQPLRNLASACYSENIPFVSVKSYGFVGTVRIATRHHAIVESKPDSSPPDLRLASMMMSSSYRMPELEELVQSIDLAELDDAEHSHIPYIILLLKAMTKWQGKHIDTKNVNVLPKTLQEKDEFKSIVKHMSRNIHMEVNFEEACRDAYLAYSVRELPYEVQELVDHMSFEVIESSFDVMVMALKIFLKDSPGGEPPIHGSIPDMTSSTELYIQLQHIYKAQADKDVATMKTHVTDTIRQMQIQTSKPHINISVSDAELEVFCKNIFHLQVLKTRSLEQELSMQYPQLLNNESADAIKADGDNDCDNSDLEEMMDDLKMVCGEEPNAEPPEHAPLLWYLATRACELFQAQHQVYPGKDARPLSLQADTNEVHKILQRMLSHMGLLPEGEEDHLELIQSHLVASKDIVAQQVSCHNAELHCISSVVGGVASQEAVKLITHQYIPINHTFVYNGLASIAAVYKF
jgi:amyloid beta precursor protein binding protein 1